MQFEVTQFELTKTGAFALQLREAGMHFDDIALAMGWTKLEVIDLFKNIGRQKVRLHNLSRMKPKQPPKEKP